MDLTADERDDLADFFSRRFDTRFRVTDTPTPVLREAWRQHLAVANPRAILANARHRFPDDESLQAVTTLLLEPSRTADRLLGAVLFGSGVVAVAAALLVVTALGSAAWFLQPNASPGSVAPTTAPTLAVLAPATQAPQRLEIAVEAPTGRCTTPEGGIVGWWYAGTSRPPDTVRLDRMVNVRATYPSADNGWDARSTIQCVLRPGDELTLTGRPLHVEGGAYWVPLHSGDLTPPERSAALTVARSAHG